MKKLLRSLFILLREGLWIAIAGAAIYGGYLGFQYLGENRKVVEISPIERPLALVETVEVEPFEQPLPIRAEGFIRPYRQVSLSAQTGGRISELHPAILDLGSFTKGDVLVKLDDSTERALLYQTDANVQATQARLNLVLIQVKRTEELLARGVATQQTLDQFNSQKAELEASLNALRAGRRSAAIAVSNKQIIAPFDGSVREKLLEVGSVVANGQSIAEIYTDSRMEVVIPVREAEAALIPELFNEDQAKAHVSVDFAGQTYVWAARVTRVDPSLDSRTRTLSITVSLDDLDLPILRNPSLTASSSPPALINAFSKVEIAGAQLENTYAIPSTSVRNGNQIWVFDPTEGDQGMLAQIDVQPVHVDGETTFVVVDNWPSGTRLIRTSLAAASAGMFLTDITKPDMNLTAELLVE